VPQTETWQQPTVGADEIALFSRIAYLMHAWSQRQAADGQQKDDIELHASFFLGTNVLALVCTQ